jgi:hypothetical protein
VQRDKRQVEAALEAKGFDRTEGDHSYFYYRTMEGKKTTARTKTSHTPKMKSIPDELLSRMAKQCHLTKSQFLDLVDCPLDRQGYEKQLAVHGLL